MNCCWCFEYSSAAIAGEGRPSVEICEAEHAGWQSIRRQSSPRHHDQLHPRGSRFNGLCSELALLHAESPPPSHCQGSGRALRSREPLLQPRYLLTCSNIIELYCRQCMNQLVLFLQIVCIISTSQGVVRKLGSQSGSNYWRCHFRVWCFNIAEFDASWNCF